MLEEEEEEEREVYDAEGCTGGSGREFFFVGDEDDRIFGGEGERT